MTYALIFGAALAVLVALFVAGLYIALQRHSDQEEPSERIHSSGVYRLRHSPRDAIRLNKPNESEFRLHLEGLSLSKERIAELTADWSRMVEENLKAIEECDYQEIRTFYYEVPPEDAASLKLFAGVYVTRDQLSSHPELIPPFRPGCHILLQPRNAWDPGEWRPMLPGQDGKYPVPDWRDSVA